MDLGLRIGALQVVDQLRQILDRIDVVVRGRGDQADAGCCEAYCRDLFADLVAGQFAALAGLGALGHLDFDLTRIGEVMGGHAEAAAGNLLHRTRAFAAEALDLFATFAAAALAADAGHRDRECFVGLARQGAEGHRARGEAAQQAVRRLDPRQRDRVGGRGGEFEQSAQGLRAAAVGVDLGRKGPVGGRVLVARGLLQQADGLRRPLMGFAIAAPVEFTATRQRRRAGDRRRERCRMERARLPFEMGQSEARHRARRAAEIGLDERFIEAERLEYLRAAIGLQGRDAHLRHHFQDAVLERVPVAVQRIATAQWVVDGGSQIGDAGIGQPGMDGVGTVAQQGAEIVHPARLAAVDDDAAPGAQARAQQVMMQPRHRQQNRQRNARRTECAVVEQQDLASVRQRSRGRDADVVQCLFEWRFDPAGGVDAGDREALAPEVAQACEIAPGQDRRVQQHLPAVLGRGVEQVALATERAGQRSHQRLAQVVERWVRHLGEELAEVVEQRSRQR